MDSIWYVSRPDSYDNPQFELTRFDDGSYSLSAQQDSEYGSVGLELTNQEMVDLYKVLGEELGRDKSDEKRPIPQVVFKGPESPVDETEFYG